MAEKIYKCAYKLCQHSSCELAQEDAVKVGNRYMHEDCAEKSQYTIKTRDLYYEQISKSVVMKQLVKVLNDLTSKKMVDPRFMYFALDFAIQNNMPIKSPYALHYLVDNSKIKEAWRIKQAAEVARQIRADAENIDPVTQATQNTFKYSADKPVGFGSIFGR